MTPDPCRLCHHKPPPPYPFQKAGRAVSCEHVGCPENPRITGKTAAEVTRKWNEKWGEKPKKGTHEKGLYETRKKICAIFCP